MSEIYSWVKIMDLVPEGVPGCEVKDGANLSPLYPELSDWPIELIAEAFNLFCSVKKKDYRNVVTSGQRDPAFIEYVASIIT